MKKRKFKKWFLLILFNRYTYFLYGTLVCIGLFFGFYFGYKYYSDSKIIYISPLSQSSKSSSNDALKQSVSILNSLLKKNNFEVKEIKEEQDYYKVILAKDREVYISKKIDLETQVASLQLINSRLTIEGKTFKRIDFRYEKPVMVLE